MVTLQLTYQSVKPLTEQPIVYKVHDKDYYKFQPPHREIGVLTPQMRKEYHQNVFLDYLKTFKTLNIAFKKKTFENLGHILILYSESGSHGHMGKIVYFINIQDLINSET